MKKILLLILLVSLLFTTGFENVKAAILPKHQQKTIIVSQKNEETNLNTLYYKAKHGISDIKTSELPKPSIQIKNISNKNDVSLFSTNAVSPSNTLSSDVSSTAQVLKDTKTGNVEIKEVAVTSFATIQPLASSASQSGSKYDSSKSVKAYSTFYYSLKSIKGVSAIKETRVKGGWKIADSSVSISGRTVNYGCSGISTSSGIIKDQATEKHPKGNFNYGTPSSWNYIIKNASYMVLGVTTKVTLKRGSRSKWSLRLVNSY